MSKSAKEHLHDLIDHLKIVKQLTRQNLQKAQEKSKSYYDKKAKEPDFRVGNRVLLQCMKVQKGLSPKLHAKWIEPYYITNVSENNTYKLRRISDHKILKSRIHANRLKHYEDPRNYRNPIMENEPQNQEVDNQGTQEVHNPELDEHTPVEGQEDNDEFLAEKLVAKRKRNGKIFYRVKWVGYKTSTWVPE